MANAAASQCEAFRDVYMEPEQYTMTYAQERADCAGGCAASPRDFWFPTGSCVLSCGAYRVNQLRAGTLQLRFSMPQNVTL